MASLGQRLRETQKVLALDLNDETDQTPTREELAASLIADEMLADGALSSLDKSTPDQQSLKELLPLFDVI